MSTKPRAIREGEIILAAGTPHEVRIPCAVLEDGRRVINAAGVNAALGQRRQVVIDEGAGVSHLPRALAAGNVKSALDKELGGVSQGLIFAPRHGGRDAYGYEAGFLTRACRAILAARREGAGWRSTQEPLAQAAERLLGALAETGEAALIDEACGVLPDHGSYARAATDAGAAESVAALRAELAEERQARLRAAQQAEERSQALEVQVQAAAQLARRVGEMEMQVRVITTGALGESKRTLTWVLDTIDEIASFREFATDLTEQQTRGAVQEELRRALGYFSLPWSEFPYARIDDLRKWLRWLHRDARRGARHRGFNGNGVWTQPPLPFTGSDDDGEE